MAGINQNQTKSNSTIKAMQINDILKLSPTDAVEQLTRKPFTPPEWAKLEKEFNPAKHPVTDKSKYPDKAADGVVEEVTRITLNYQQLATKRMSELVCGIPIKRVYTPADDKQREASECLEAIFQRNRIDSLNIERCNALFSSCEMLTLWYATEEPNRLYGFDSPLKLRCKTYSPRDHAELYPLFDEYGDLIALSIGTQRKEGNRTVRYLDVYTSTLHRTYRSTDTEWTLVTEEEINIGKIPAIYCMRPTPIWEDTSRIVYEMEWALSRNGNYLRKNSKPIFAVFADEEIAFTAEQDERKEYRTVVQYPKGSQAGYLTWSQAIESLKFYIAELRQSFFTQLQLPDWSYESMKSTPMSGESRKQLFIDAQLKVTEESGRLLAFYDREVNVVKAFLAQLRPDLAEAIEALPVEVVITPYQIAEERDTILNLLAANGNRPLISQREAIEQLGWSTNALDTLHEIQAEQALNAYEIAE